LLARHIYFQLYYPGEHYFALWVPWPGVKRIEVKMFLRDNRYDLSG
jgi:hypothetical protein